MKIHLLLLLRLVLVLATLLYCFHVHEERHRFVVLGKVFDHVETTIMFDRKTHKSCMVLLSDKPDNSAYACPQ